MEFSLNGRTNLEEVCRNRKTPSSLLEYANKNRNLEFFNDVVICVENGRFPANKLVLSCFSPFFEKMFKVEMKEKYQNTVDIKCVDEDSLKNLIEYIYTGSININSNNVCKLLSASDYLQIEDVKQFCFDFLDEALTAENCLIILSIADRYRNESIMDRAEDVIKGNFDITSRTLEFKSLSQEDLIKFIFKQKRNEVGEISKFKALVIWTKHDEENRANQFFSLTKRVNLEELSTKFLEDVVLKEALVLQNHDLCKLLLEKLQTKIMEIKKWHGTRILSLGGTDTKSKVTKVFNCIDEAAVSFPDLSDGQSHGCSLILHEYLYYIGGYRGGSTNTVWRINITEQEFKWEDVQSMNCARCDMGASIVNESLVVVGGFNGSRRVASGEMYSPMLNSWECIPSMMECRSGNSLITCKRDLYSIGGCDDIEFLSSVERLAFGSRDWEFVEPMQTPRSYQGSVCCLDLIYVFGGTAGIFETPLKSAEMYDPTTNQWTYISDMIFHRVGCSAVVLEEKIYVVGGLDEKCQAVTEVECYDPFTKEWRIVEKTDCGLFNHSLVVL